MPPNPKPNPNPNPKPNPNRSGIFLGGNCADTIVLDKRKSYNADVKFVIGSEGVQAASSVDIRGIAIDDKLNFNFHKSTQDTC